jgi:hypothetical protein
MPYQTAMGPKPKKRIRMVDRATLESHMEREETIIEYFTSPAALRP